jgi:hypothetical protein
MLRATHVQDGVWRKSVGPVAVRVPAGRLRVVLQPIMATKKGNRTGGLRAFSLQPPRRAQPLNRPASETGENACVPKLPTFQTNRPLDAAHEHGP